VMLYLVLIAVSIVPQDTSLRDSVDVLERHWFYDENGREVFQQLIGWNDEENVRFWRRIKCESQIPVREWPSGYRVTFMDEEQVRTVYAPSFRERWGNTTWNS
jgi:hypothetical protein